MDVCSRLWCAVVRQGQMVCLTKKLPAVEGTPCGKGRICLHGKCVDKTKKKYYSVCFRCKIISHKESQTGANLVGVTVAKLGPLPIVLNLPYFYLLCN